MSDIWIDLDNAPHVVFFAPVARALEARGMRVLLTARDVNSTPELARAYGLDPVVTGRAFGKSRLGKIAGTLEHAGRLTRIAAGRRPALAVSHGSRSQAIAAGIMRIPLLLFFDYENANLRVFRLLNTWYAYPDRIESELGPMDFIRAERRLAYRGLKEHLALLSRRCDDAALHAAGVPVGERFAVIRPESDTAHYLEGIDDRPLLAAVRASSRWGLVPVVVPRSSQQCARLMPILEPLGRVVVPSVAVNGVDLLARARLLVSGGGTMNREAVVLGLPCISMFRGALGALDRAFIAEQRMVHAPTAETIDLLPKPPEPPPVNDAEGMAADLLAWIVQRLETLAGVNRTMPMSYPSAERNR